MDEARRRLHAAGGQERGLLLAQAGSRAWQAQHRPVGPRTSLTSLSGSFSWNLSAHTATFQASLAVAPISTDESETRGGGPGQGCKASKRRRQAGNGGLSLQGRERLPIRRGGLGKGGRLQTLAALGLGKSLLGDFWLLGDQGLGHSFTPQACPLRPPGLGSQGGRAPPLPFKNSGASRNQSAMFTSQLCPTTCVTQGRFLNLSEPR